MGMLLRLVIPLALAAVVVVAAINGPNSPARKSPAKPAPTRSLQLLQP